MNMSTTEQALLSPAQYLYHLQGHRSLTRKTIEAFPDDQLFTFKAAETMRPFGVIAWELHLVSEYTLNGLESEQWNDPDYNKPSDKTALLEAWDALTEQFNERFTKIPLEQYQKTHSLSWGDMTGLTVLFYNLDNEIHHRGQGYVYLRALGIEPPLFYQRQM
jgi:uncharacterized damage-inducible protein DinB